MVINDCLDCGYKIFYWRTSNGQEVDFILYGPKGFLAFEIKRTARITPSMFSGLKAFLSEYPMAKAFFLYGGNRRKYEKEIEIVPIVEAFKNLKTLLLENTKKISE